MQNVQPRNSLVLVRLLLTPEEQVGSIVVPTSQNEYAEAEIIAVGPGMVQAAGGIAETFDLKPGQTVLVKHKIKSQRATAGGVVESFMPAGIRLRSMEGTRPDFYLFEQASIIAILMTNTPKEHSNGTAA